LRLWAGLAALAALLAVAGFAGEPVRVDSDSMLPTLRPGRWLWLDKLHYRQRAPQRGEVVVVRLRGVEGGRFVKRVIGLPGERIDVVDEVVFVDGEPLPRRHLGALEHGDRVFEAYEEAAGARRYRVLDDPERDTLGGRFELDSDQYLLLGDHRDHSEDGRAWGPVDRGELLGPVWVGGGL